MGSTIEIPAWAEVARKQKMSWVENDERGDIPPMVIAERDGVPWAMAFAKQVDKDQGLEAALMFRLTIDPDVLILTFDAHMANLEPGESIEDFKKNKLKGRTMQEACDEDDACALDLTVDVLMAHRITRDKKYEMVIMPYKYHGKGGPPFEWLDDRMTTMEDGVQTSGYIIDSFNKIMNVPPMTDDPRLKQAADAMGMSREQQYFHSARSGIIMLASKGYKIMDLITPLHPEWVDLNKPYPSNLMSVKF